MNDRVETSMTFVMNLGDYQSAHIHAGYQSDVKPGETEDEAYARINRFVDAKVGEQAQAISQRFAEKRRQREMENE